MVSYQPRWFTGTYLGPNQDVKEVPENSLVFMSDQNKAVYIEGGIDLYHIGKRYRFQFRPDKKFFKNGIISVDSLLVHPQAVDTGGSSRPTPTKKPIYPRKNVILTLDDHSEVHGDILADDGENYVIRIKDQSGQIKISKSRVVSID